MQQSVREIEEKLRQLRVPESVIEKHVEALRRLRGHNGIPRVRLVYDPYTGEYTRYKNRRRRPPGRHYVRAT